MAVRSLTRRDCLKLVLAANAAWVGSLLLGSWAAALPGPPMLGGAVPIEGLGLSIRLTNFLRASGITTIGRLVDVLSGADHASRSPVATRTELAEMLRFRPAQEQIRTRLAAFRKSGPVPFATLTDLETAVRDLILEGRSNKAMSAKLGVSENVIEAQLTSMYRKMQGLCAPYVA